MLNSFITCPYCGYEYTPSEIYVPDNFLGKSKNIVRSAVGEVLGYEGIEPELDEIYCCDNCQNEFKISAKVTFTTSIETEKEDTKGLFDI